MFRDVFEEVARVLAGRFVFDGELTPETRFIEDLGADSLDIIQLLEELEQMFEITLAPGDLIRMQTVGDVVRYIEEHICGES